MCHKFGGIIIKKLKIAYNDIFGKNIADYWEDEGCNQRMQKYKVVSKGLNIFKHIIEFAFLSYLLYLALQVLALLLTNVSICDKIICNEIPSYGACLFTILNKLKLYGMIYLMIVFMNEYFFGDITVKRMYKSLLLFLGISPAILLIVINFNIYSTGLITMFLMVLYVFMTFCINLLKGRIDFLYDVSVGEFSNVKIKDQKTEENKEVKEEIKKDFKNKKRRK